MTFVWIVVFIASLIALVKSSDFLVDSASEIGKYFALPGFIIGVLIVGVGTSAPELASSIFSVIQGAPEMVVANAIGSNIANILLIVGFSAILAKNIKVSKELIDLDIPLLILSTVLFLLTAYDGSVSRYDSVFLLAGLLFYITYSIAGQKNEKVSGKKDIKIIKEIIILIVSLVILTASAKYLVVSVIAMSKLFNVAVSAITLLAVALGTSLPELFVSVSSIKKGHADMALGNIFGSNIFNLLAVVGIPAAFSVLPVDKNTLSVAVPMLIVATVLFAVSGISKRVHIFEGVFYLIIYAFFVVSVLGL